MTLGLLRGPYRGEIEITITRRLMGRIPLTGPNGCPMVECSAAAAGAARTRVRDSPSESERLALREHPTPGLVHSEAPAGLGAGGLQSEGRAEGQAGEESDWGTALGGVMGKEDERFSAGEGGEGGEGGETDLGARGGILMQDLQRDPWADPPPDKEAPLVYPERWGTGDYSGWGRGGASSIACNIASGSSGEGGLNPGNGWQEGEAPTSQVPAEAWSARGWEGSSREGHDSGERRREQTTGGEAGVLGPTTRPTNFSTSFPPDPAPPTKPLAHATEPAREVGDGGGAAAAPGYARTWNQAVTQAGPDSSPGGAWGRRTSAPEGASGDATPMGVGVEVTDALVQLDSLARELSGDRNRERDIDREREKENARGREGVKGLEGTSGPSSAGATPATSGS